MTTPTTIPPFPAARLGAVLVLPRGEGKVLVVSVHNSIDGDARLDVRAWHWNRSAGTWEPGRQGAEIRAHEIEAFRRAVLVGGSKVAEVEAKRRGTTTRSTATGGDDA